MVSATPREASPAPLPSPPSFIMRPPRVAPPSAPPSRPISPPAPPPRRLRPVTAEAVATAAAAAADALRAADAAGAEGWTCDLASVDVSRAATLGCVPRSAPLHDPALPSANPAITVAGGVCVRSVLAGAEVWPADGRPASAPPSVVRRVTP